MVGFNLQVLCECRTDLGDLDHGKWSQGRDADAAKGRLQPYRHIIRRSKGLESDDDDGEYKHGPDEESPKKGVKRARGKVQNGTAKRRDERSTQPWH